jgi:hypothetical protein
MPGARLILNTRYFHIARAGEQADGKHVMTKMPQWDYKLCWRPGKRSSEYAKPDFFIGSRSAIPSPTATA